MHTERLAFLASSRETMLERVQHMEQLVGV
jgi:hypothetical protein